MSAHAANPPASALASADRPGRNWGMIALIVGVVCIAVSVVGLFLGVSNGEERPFIGWLIGSTFWLSLMIGSLILTMLSYVFDAGWMVIIRRQLEHVLAGFKWVALLFVPLLLVALFAAKSGGQPWFWLDPGHIVGHGEAVANDPLYIKKAAYLNSGFFAFRFVLYFVIWVGLTELLRRASFRMDDTGDVRHYNAAYRYSAAGVILTALALTFASIDWFGTIEYHWFSTMYGVWFFAACVRSAVALAIVIGAAVATRKGWLHNIYGRSHSYLLGCLLLAFTVFWAYISFAQYFLQYNANIPEEVFWYNMREFRYENGEVVKNSWWWVSMFLIFAHFLVPFLYLLFYKSKFGARIVFIALWVLVFHALDLYWNILPQRLYDSHGLETVRQFGISIWDVTTFVGVGGICLWAFLSSAARHKAVPIRDPRIMESINHHE